MRMRTSLLPSSQRKPASEASAKAPPSHHHTKGGNQHPKYKRAGHHSAKAGRPREGRLEGRSPLPFYPPIFPRGNQQQLLSILRPFLPSRTYSSTPIYPLICETSLVPSSVLLKLPPKNIYPPGYSVSPICISPKKFFLSLQEKEIKGFNQENCQKISLCRCKMHGQNCMDC